MHLTGGQDPTPYPTFHSGAPPPTRHPPHPLPPPTIQSLPRPLPPPTTRHPPHPLPPPFAPHYPTHAFTPYSSPTPYPTFHSGAPHPIPPFLPTHCHPTLPAYTNPQYLPPAQPMYNPCLEMLVGGHQQAIRDIMQDLQQQRSIIISCLQTKGNLATHNPRYQPPKGPRFHSWSQRKEDTCRPEQPTIPRNQTNTASCQTDVDIEISTEPQHISDTLHACTESQPISDTSHVVNTSSAVDPTQANNTVENKQDSFLEIGQTNLNPT